MLTLVMAYYHCRDLIKIRIEYIEILNYTDIDEYENSYQINLDKYILKILALKRQYSDEEIDDIFENQEYFENMFSMYFVESFKAMYIDDINILDTFEG